MHSVQQPHPPRPNSPNSSRVPPMTGQGSYSTKTPHPAQPPPPPPPPQQHLQQGLLPTPPPRPGQPGMYHHPPPPLHSYATQQNLQYASYFPLVSGGGLLPLPSQHQMIDKAPPPKPVDDHGSTASPLRSSGIQFSMQANEATVGAGSHSPADSDMEMEDDITRSENEQVVIHPIGGPRNTCDSTSSNRIDVKEHFCGGQGLVESDAYKVALSDKVLIPSSSGPDQQGPKLISGDDHLMVERPASRDHRLVGSLAVVAVHPLSMNKEFSATHLAEDKSSSGALAAAECTVFNEYSGQSMKGKSLFKHVQDYASDDNLIKGQEPSMKDASSKVVPELVATSAEDLPKNNAGNLETDIRSKSSLSFGVYELSLDAQKEVEDVGPAVVASVTATEHADTKHEDPESVDITVSPRTSSREDGSQGPGENVALSSNYPKKNEDIGAKIASTAPKVDKFGRLAREGSGDSDSDDSLYNGRHGKRGRDHSRSRSPVGRRWRRRSPLRRRGKRSRSRSWSPVKRRSRSRSPRNQRSRSRSPRNRRNRSRSPRNRRSRSRSPRNRRSRSRSPRNRRSRSRSPVFKRTGVGSGKIRGDRAQMPDCFDFLKGKCYRGASCRYLHHDSDKTDGSRHHRNKQQFLQHHNSRNSNTQEEIKIDSLKEKDDQHQIMSQEMQLNQGMLSCCAVRDSGSLKSHNEAFQTAASLKNSTIQQSQSDYLYPVLEDADSLPQGTDGSAISDSPLDKALATPLHKLPASGTLPSRTGYMLNSSYQPMLPTSGPLLAGTNAQSTTQLTRNANLTPQVSGVQSRHVSVEGCPHYTLPSQNSSFPVPPNSSWPSLPLPQQLPPPNPSINAGTAPPVVSVQFQLSKLPPSHDFGPQIHSMPNSTELPTQSQVGEFQHQSYPLVPELHQPLPGSSQQYGGATPLSEDCQMQLPVNGENASGSFTNVNNLTQQKPFLQKSPANEPLSFPCGNLLPGENAKSCSQVHPCSQQQQPSFYGQFQNNGSSSRNLLDILDAYQHRQMSDLGVSGNSTYHNSYASNFEMPLSSRLNSSALGQEKGTSYVSKYDHPSSLSHASVDGRGIGSVGSTQATLSQISTIGARQMIPNSSTDQYDPLFDSIEPSTNLSKNFNHSHKWQPSNDSDTLVRNSVSNKLLDVEENSKEVGGIALATSVDDEEFGETADVEVEDVDNVSRSSPNAIANVNMGEMEIDQIKSSENRKKSKESRSMKLFKVCLANFVKEVLKPSWRQGNMSKETFKIVVKKTVDKVSEAMGSHHIPKSKAKIDHYIDSQQRKLTKLVMGYVDKYAKG